MYDLYLSAGCHSAIDIAATSFSPEFISGLDLVFSNEQPGFLSLSLDWKTAHMLITCLRLHGARGLIIDVKYHNPMVTLEQATQIAEEALDKLQKSYPHVRFNPTRHLRGQSHPMWWTFVSVGQEWVDAGMTPGRLAVSIDKADGQIWSNDDMRRFHESQE